MSERLGQSIVVEDKVGASGLVVRLGVRGRTRTRVTEPHRISVYGATNRGELYGLDEDPLELRKLRDEPSAAGLHSALTERRLRAMLVNIDTVPKPTRFA
jgi:hypothetical protein